MTAYRLTVFWSIAGACGIIASCVSWARGIFVCWNGSLGLLHCGFTDYENSVSRCKGNGQKPTQTDGTLNCKWLRTKNYWIRRRMVKFRLAPMEWAYLRWFRLRVDTHSPSMHWDVRLLRDAKSEKGEEYSLYVQHWYWSLVRITTGSHSACFVHTHDPGESLDLIIHNRSR